jgi:hypothetical protein
MPAGAARAFLAQKGFGDVMGKARVVRAGPVRLGRFVVGDLHPDGTFWRRILERHIVKSPPSLALDVRILEDLQWRGCLAVAYSMPDGRILTCPFDAYAVGRAILISRGYGTQRAVLFEDFTAIELEGGTVGDLLPRFSG